jgi:sugar lactone lactonase YvrE
MRTLALGSLAHAAAAIAGPTSLAQSAPASIDTYGGRWRGDGWRGTMAAFSYGGGLFVARASGGPLGKGDVLIGVNHDVGIRRVAAGADGTVEGAPDEIASIFDSQTGTFIFTADAAGNFYYVDYDPTDPTFSLAAVWELPAAGGGAGVLLPGLGAPAALAFDDASGLLYIAMADRGSVLAVDALGTASTVVAGLLGPQGVCVARGVLYVADSPAHEIFAVDLGASPPAARPFASLGGIVTTPGADPFFPGEIGCHPNFPLEGSLFVAPGFDPSSTAPILLQTRAVLRIDATGAPAIAVGNGSPGPLPPDGAPAVSGGFSFNAGDIAVDAAGDLYFESNFCIFKIKADGTCRRVAGNPYGEGVAAGTGMITLPLICCLDGDGDLLVADSFTRTVRRIDRRTGLMSTAVGFAVVPSSGWRDGPADQALFNQLQSVACGPSGILYIGEGRNALFRAVLPGTPPEVVTIAGIPPTDNLSDGSWGPFTTFHPGYEPIPDGTPARAAALADNFFGHTAAEDALGNLVITDAGDPFFDGDGNIDVNGHNMIYLIAPAPGNRHVVGAPGEVIRVVAGQVIGLAAGPRGSPLAGGEGVPARGTPVSFPTSPVFDARGDLYFIENDASRIRKITRGAPTPDDPSGLLHGTIATIAGPPGAGNPFEDPQFDPSQPMRDGPALQATFAFPSQIAFGGPGVLYVADGFHGVVREIAGLDSPGGAQVSTIAGTGADDYAGDGGPPLSAALGTPFGLAADAAGNVFFTEVDNRTVRELYPAGASLALGPIGAVATTRLTLDPPAQARDVLADEVTLELLDPATRIPLGPWSDALRAQGAGPVAVASFDGRALAGAGTAGGVVARERAELADGGFAAASTPAQTAPRPGGPSAGESERGRPPRYGPPRRGR